MSTLVYFGVPGAPEGGIPWEPESQKSQGFELPYVALTWGHYKPCTCNNGPLLQIPIKKIRPSPEEPMELTWNEARGGGYFLMLPSAEGLFWLDRGFALPLRCFTSFVKAAFGLVAMAVACGL